MNYIYALTDQGLVYLWSKIKEKFVEKGDIVIPVNPSTTPTKNGAIWITTN